MSQAVASLATAGPIGPRPAPAGAARPETPQRRTAAAAVVIGALGRIRRFDLGVVNGEHFGVMAGAGSDARMIDAADQEARTRSGSLAYVRSGAIEGER